MVIVDTSYFIELLRGSSVPELKSLIAAGLVKLSSTVHLELFQGVRRTEQAALLSFLKVLGPPVPWPALDTCMRVIRKGGAKGFKIGLPDIMIIADVIEQKAKLMTLDVQMKKLASLLDVKIIVNN